MFEGIKGGGKGVLNICRFFVLARPRPLRAEAGATWGPSRRAYSPAMAHARAIWWVGVWREGP